MADSTRHLQAVAAAHASWAKTKHPAQRTAAGRRAFLDRFEREVDPLGVLDRAERARRAEHARKAYFAELAAKSVRARHRRARAAMLDAH
jgi:hypothetical protein